MNDAFGYWLAGLTDGEGHFGVRAYERAGVYRVDPIFSIGLRSDDEPILREIQAALGVGTVRTHRYGDRKPPLTRWDVQRLDDLRTVIVPLFIRYPLRTRKAAEFPVWAAILELVHEQRVRRLTQLSRDELGRLGGSCVTWAGPAWETASAACAQLREMRAYPWPVPA